MLSVARSRCAAEPACLDALRVEVASPASSMEGASDVLTWKGGAMGVLGSEWFAGWLRARREGLGLERPRLVALANAARAPEESPLSANVVVDLERGARLPASARLPALARGLGLSPMTLSGIVLAAPRLEPAWRPLARERMRAEALLRRAEGALYAGRPDEAAAAGELASRALVPGAGGRALVLFAAGLVPLGLPELARAMSAPLLEDTPALAGEARLVIAESLLVEGRPTRARLYLDALEARSLESAPLRVRLGLARFAFERHRGRHARALEAASSALSERLPAGAVVLKERLRAAIALAQPDRGGRGRSRGNALESDVLLLAPPIGRSIFGPRPI